MTEYAIQTPTGRRVLDYMGHGFAQIREGFAPGDVNVASERLVCQIDIHKPRRSSDGLWIGAEHLFSISMKMAHRRKAPLHVNEVVSNLFYEPNRPDALKLFAGLDASGAFIRTMARFGAYDPASGWFVPDPNYVYRPLSERERLERNIFIG